MTDEVKNNLILKQILPSSTKKGETTVRRKIICVDRQLKASGEKVGEGHTRIHVRPQTLRFDWPSRLSLNLVLFDIMFCNLVRYKVKTPLD